MIYIFEMGVQLSAQQQYDGDDVEPQQHDEHAGKAATQREHGEISYIEVKEL